MPLHAYQCPECGFQFEALVSLKAKENPPCPECESIYTTRMLSAPSPAQWKCQKGSL